MRVFTGHSITSKPIGSRMGKGKGVHSLWVCYIRAGQVICELSGIKDFIAIKSLINASTKLPLKTKVFKLYF